MVNQIDQKKQYPGRKATLKARNFLKHLARHLHFAVTLVLLNQDLSFFENTKDPDQLASYEAI